MTRRLHSTLDRSVASLAIVIAMSICSPKSNAWEALADQSMPGLVTLTLRTPNPELRNVLPDSEYDEIEQWLDSYGIKILSKDSAPFVRTIRVEGTAAQFEAALHLNISQSASKVWYANMSDPWIPARFGGVIAAFAGLDNLRGFGRAPSQSER
jgi:hypothetical protein